MTDTSREAVLSPVRDTMKRPRRVRQHSIRGLTNHIHRQRNHVMAEANTSVYLYFDSDGILIYVGVTGRGIARQREHERDKPWWAYTARQEIEHYETRAQALDRERFLIVTMCPPFNTVHNGDVLVRDAYLRLHAEAENLPTEAPRKRALRIRDLEAAHERDMHTIGQHALAQASVLDKLRAAEAKLDAVKAVVTGWNGFTGLTREVLTILADTDEPKDSITFNTNDLGPATDIDGNPLADTDEGNEQ